MNNVKLIGRLAKDPEVRYTKTGKAVASFTVAVNRQVREGQQESADFIPVVVWGSLAELCGNSLSKGKSVFVGGRLQVRPYETTDGQKRRIAEVVANFVGQSLDGQKQGSSPFDELGKEIDEKIPF